MMDRILAGLDFCFWYLDDVIVASPSHQQHLLHLEQLFSHLQAHGLVINLEKFLSPLPTSRFWAMKSQRLAPSLCKVM
jgi:hypothetical protein